MKRRIGLVCMAVIMCMTFLAAPAYAASGVIEARATITVTANISGNTIIGSASIGSAVTVAVTVQLEKQVGSTWVPVPNTISSATGIYTATASKAVTLETGVKYRVCAIGTGGGKEGTAYCYI